MSDRDLVTPTKRRAMTKKRAAAIFLREQGRCYLCGLKLRAGVDAYQIEHPVALVLGGSDDDADLRVVCIPCHKPKTKADAGARAKRDRIVTAGWKGNAKRNPMPGSRASRFKRKIGGPTVDRETGQPVARKETR